MWGLKKIMSKLKMVINSRWIKTVVLHRQTADKHFSSVLVSICVIAEDAHYAPFLLQFSYGFISLFHFFIAGVCEKKGGKKKKSRDLWLWTSAIGDWR